MNLSQIGVRLLVKDFGRSFDFFTKILEMEVSWGSRDDVYASFKPKGGGEIAIAIFLAEKQTMYKGYFVPEGSGTVDQAIYCIPTEDVDKDFAMLKAKGVEVIGEPQDMEAWYMRCAYFRDYEGNMFELSQGL